jgi:hypothetical protein
VDGKLSGAVAAGTLAFISADCLNEPSDQAHASRLNASAKSADWSYWDVSDATVRNRRHPRGTAGDYENRGGSGRNELTGWSAQQDVLLRLATAVLHDMRVWRRKPDAGHGLRSSG